MANYLNVGDQISIETLKIERGMLKRSITASELFVSRSADVSNNGNGE